jgi:Tfp pilus assembly protein PilE
MLQNHSVNRPKNNAGLTLVETAIVLAVVSVIIAAVWSVSSVVYENARQYQANRQLQSTVQNARQLYTRINGFTAAAGSDLAVTLDKQDAFPKEMRVVQGTACTSAPCALNHPWSSVSTGTVTAFVGSTSNSFAIKFSALTKKACVGLATKLSGGDISNLLSIKINSGSYLSGTSLPVGAVGADVACTSATANSIEWVFDIRA